MADVDGLIFGGLIKNENRFWNSIFGALVGIWSAAALVFVFQKAIGKEIPYWETTHVIFAGAFGTAAIAFTTTFARMIHFESPRVLRLVALRVGLFQLAMLLLMFDETVPMWTRGANVGAIFVGAVMIWHAFAVARYIRPKMNGLLRFSLIFAVAAAVHIVISLLFLLLGHNGVGVQSKMVLAHINSAVWGFSWFAILTASTPMIPRLSNVPLNPIAARRAIPFLIVHSAAVVLSSCALALGANIVAGVFLFVGFCASLMFIHPVFASVLGAAELWNGSILGFVGALTWHLALMGANTTTLLMNFDVYSMYLLITPALIGAALMQATLSMMQHILPHTWGESGASDPSAYAEFVLINMGALLTILSFGGNTFEIGLVLIGIGLASKFAIVIRHRISFLKLEK